MNENLGRVVIGSARKYGNQGEYQLLLFWWSTQFIKIYDALKLLLTQDHTGLEISKSYSSYTFDPIWAKLYDQ